DGVQIAVTDPTRFHFDQNSPRRHVRHRHFINRQRLTELMHDRGTHCFRRHLKSSGGVAFDIILWPLTYHGASAVRLTRPYFLLPGFTIRTRFTPSSHQSRSTPRSMLNRAILPVALSNASVDVTVSSPKTEASSTMLPSGAMMRLWPCEPLASLL